MSEIIAVPTVAVSASAESGARPSMGPTEGPSGNGRAFSRTLQEVTGSRPASPDASSEGHPAVHQSEGDQSDDQQPDEPTAVQAVAEHILTVFVDLESARPAGLPPAGEGASSTDSLLQTVPGKAIAPVGPQAQPMPGQSSGGAGTGGLDTELAQGSAPPAPENDLVNVIRMSSNRPAETSGAVPAMQAASGQATGMDRPNSGPPLLSDLQTAVAVVPVKTEASLSDSPGSPGPRLTGIQVDLPPPPATSAARDSLSVLHGGQHVGETPITAGRQLRSTEASLGGNQLEPELSSVKPLGDPASDLPTMQEQWDRNGEPTGQGSALYGNHARESVLAGQAPAASHGSETRSALSLSEPVRPTLQPGASWDTLAPRAMRLELQSPDGPPVRLHVSLVEQTVYAKVVTDQTEVQDFLLRNQSRLESQLHNHGLEMGQFSVLVDRQGQGPWSYGWESIWQQSDRRGQGAPSPTEPDAVRSAGLEAGEPRRVNLFV
jgi:hypothetical protein